ncbi:MAG TPA: hypothetical protein VMT38_05185 [Terracidiphilus sp.]|nr:hypothetical protein [Terracidiphilus sp.]
MTSAKEATRKDVPWRESLSFVSTYYSILAAIAGGILALAIGDPEVKNTWYLPVFLLALSMFCFVMGHEKCVDAFDEDDVDKYLAWLLAYNIGTIAMIFGIATYIVLHYRPPWAIFVVVLTLALTASWKWLLDTKYLLFQADDEYREYREELLGKREPEHDPDWLMRSLQSFRHQRTRKAEK